jgi:hypothetical protein
MREQMTLSKFKTCLIFAVLGSSTAAAAQFGLFDFSNPAANVAISATVMERPPRYSGGFNCQFRVRTYRDSKRTSEAEFSITTTSVGDQILINHNKAEGVSSMLFSVEGELIDYNVPSGSGTRVSPDSDSRSPFSRDLPTSFHPYFPVTNGVQPETLYGEIVGPDKELIGKLLYRGKVMFSRPAVYVFDIMGLEKSRQMPNGFPVGRLTIDSSDGMPHILVLGASNRVQYERRDCGKGE